MNFWPLIVLFGTCFSQWTTAAPVTNAIYDLSNGTLQRVTPTNISIDLSNLHIKFLADNCFQSPENVVSLNLSNNELVRLPWMFFAKFVKLRYLSLSNNKLSSVYSIFVGLMSLEYLDISGNPILILGKGDLFGVPNSVRINVERTGLGGISTQVYKNPFTPIISGNLSVFASIERRKPALDEVCEEDSVLDNYTIKVCINPDGILESLEEVASTAEVGNCTLQTRSENICVKKQTIFLENLGIKGFKPKWYGIRNIVYDNIDFSDNSISELGPELINDLPPTIKVINLSDNKITAIENNGIENNNSITINLSDNRISRIEDGAFGKLNLHTLVLELNHLRSTAFARTLPSTIRSLKLGYNAITDVPLNSFYGLKNLVSLSMRVNRLEKIEPGTFRDQESLSSLDLSSNEIGALEPGLFQGLGSLEILDLSFNEIKEIPSNVFEEFNPLPTAKLSLLLISNPLKLISDGALSGINLRKLDMRWTDFEDGSISEETFNGSAISELFLWSNKLTNLNGEWFRGVSGLEKVSLSSDSISRLEKGIAKHMKSVIFLDLTCPDLKILQDGVLYGLSTKKEIMVNFRAQKLEIIEGGLFDNL